jgi:hypothetical protein
MARRREQRAADDAWSGEARHALGHQRHTAAGRNEAEKRVQVSGLLHDRRFQPGLSAYRNQEVIVSGRVSPREQEQSLAAKRPERQRPASCETVTFRKRDDQRLPHERLHGQHSVGGGEPQEADVDLSCAKHFELLTDADKLKHQFDARAALAEYRQQSGENIQLGRGHVSDDELSDLATCRTARNLDRPFRLDQCRSRFDKERAARIRQENAPARPMEEGDAESPFKRADLLTQRRLRDVKPPRRAPEVSLFGDGDEVS